MLSEVLRRTSGEFGARLQAFAPNLLAMLVLLLAGRGRRRGPLRSRLLLPRLASTASRAQRDRGRRPTRRPHPRPSRAIALALPGWCSRCSSSWPWPRWTSGGGGPRGPRVRLAAPSPGRDRPPRRGGLVPASPPELLIAAVNAGLPSARLLASGAHAALVVLFAAMALEEVDSGSAWCWPPSPSPSAGSCSPSPSPSASRARRLPASRSSGCCGGGGGGRRRPSHL